MAEAELFIPHIPHGLKSALERPNAVRRRDDWPVRRTFIGSAWRAAIRQAAAATRMKSNATNVAASTALVWNHRLCIRQAVTTASSGPRTTPAAPAAVNAPSEVPVVEVRIWGMPGPPNRLIRASLEPRTPGARSATLKQRSGNSWRAARRGGYQRQLEPGCLGLATVVTLTLPKAPTVTVIVKPALVLAGMSVATTQGPPPEGEEVLEVCAPNLRAVGPTPRPPPRDLPDGSRQEQAAGGGDGATPF